MDGHPGMRDEVVAALRGAVAPTLSVAAWIPVPGGDIHRASRIELDDGGVCFLKWNPGLEAALFEAEADGLRALAEAAGDELRVPRPIAFGGGDGQPAWLLMEYLERATGDARWGERLGRGLARLHRAGATAGWGWESDNWIGSLTQANARLDEGWAAFWRDRRIGPQLEMARAGGHFRGGEGRDFDRLMDRMEDLLGDVDDPPSLLHGDLWGGNVMPTVGGTPAIYDPAVYRGHREVDLAMSELFGFPPRFLAAYREAWPLAPGYDERRRDLYQLYYLLVHVVLFGGGYAGSAHAAARRVLATI